MPNPWMIIGVIVALGGVYGYAHHAGYAKRNQEMQLEIALKNDEAREKEHQLTEKLNQNSIALQEANNVITEKQSSLDRAIRAGRVRLPAPGCVQASSSPSPATGDRNDEASESERQTLAAIAAIVAEGDRNTAQLNACIQAYNEVMEKVNGK